MSSNGLFFQTICPKLRDIQFTVIQQQRKTSNIHIFLSFLFKNCEALLRIVMFEKLKDTSCNENAFPSNEFVISPVRIICLCRVAALNNYYFPINSMIIEFYGVSPCLLFCVVSLYLLL